MYDFRKEANNLFKLVLDIADSEDDKMIDVNSTDNVIEIEIDDKVFIINKQTQVEEVWLSSPLSGPYHFGYNQLEKAWLDRNNVNIIDLVKSEIHSLIN